MTLGLEGRCSIQLSYGRMSPFGSIRGTRTLKPDWATDFKSVAYANSAMVPKNGGPPGDRTQYRRFMRPEL